MFSDLYLPLPDELVDKPQSARHWLAKKLDDEDPSIISELFNYEAGHPKLSFNPFRIFANKRSLVIRTIGSAATKWWLSIGSWTVREALGVDDASLHTGTVCAAIDKNPSNLYAVRQMVFISHQRVQLTDGKMHFPTPPNIRTGEGLDNGMIEKISADIRRSILDQASHCDIALSPDDILITDIAVSGTLNPIVVKESNDFRKLHISVKRVTFRTNLHLSGPWSAGYLLGRGYGRIHPKKINP